MKEYPKDIKLEDYAGDDMARVTELEKMFQAAKDARRYIVTRWRRNEELYDGRFLAPFNLPSYKCRIEPNIIHSIIETMYSILTDRPPKVDIMPKTEEQITSAYKAQQAVEWCLAEKKAQRAVSYMKRDGLLYGNGFLKISIVDGDVKFTVPSPFSVFIDPLATSIDTANCVIFATPTYVDEIKETYGKVVGTEGKLDEYQSFIKTKSEYANDKVPAIETDGPLEKKSNTDYKGGMAILKEAFFYKDGKLMLATWAGKTLLQYVESPYDFIPLVMFKNYPSAHSLYGKGEAEICESLATGAAIALSQGMDNLILNGNPVIVMSKSLSKIPGNRITDKPGSVLFVNGPHERIDRLPAGNISASTLPLAQSLIQMADSVSGVHDVTKGMTPGSVTASRAIQQLNEASQTVIRAKEREIGIDAVVEIYKMTLNLLSKNYPKTISIRRPSEDGSGYSFDKIQPYDLDSDLDFAYRPGSSLPESRAARRDEAIDLLQLGLLDEEGFWRHSQVDITKQKLEEITQAKAQRQKQIEDEMKIMSDSTDEDEIMDSLLRHRELSGAGVQDEPETPNT